MNDIRIEGLDVSFGRIHALGGVDLRLVAGQTTVLVGPNGAGKSTLISVLLGLVRPDKGRICADGSEVCSARSTTQQAFRSRIGYLPEAPAFSENLTGRQVLKFFASARGVGREAVEQTLSRVGLSAAAARSVGGYSRGMRQRLGLGVAVLASPDVLVLDEPTGGLDQEGLSVLWSVLDESRAAGRIVLLSTHELALIERRADVLCVMNRGVLLASGSPDALRRRAALPIRVRLDLPDAEAAIQLASGLDRATVDGCRLSVTVASGELLALLQRLDGLPIEHLRVEEPGLDEVYQSILEGGPAWDVSSAP